MKILLAGLAAVLVAGNLHAASGSSNETTTSNNMDSTTDFRNNPDVQRIIYLYETANITSCIDEKKDVCTKEPTNIGSQFNRESFCKMLKLYSACIENCSQELRDGTRQGLKQFSCDGCAFLQGSFIVVMLVSLFHYFL